MEAAKAILVTGASTGIGRSVAERLAAAGHWVYATARKDDDLDELNAIDRVHPLRLDVLDSALIAAAVAEVSAAGRGLYGLVNNAGIATMDSIIDSKETEFDLVMAVNVRGVCRVTKAFAPLVVASMGRIVTVGSISGILAEPGIGAYSMSKHAVEALTDVLAGEVGPYGVAVSLIEPGNFSTAILKNVTRRTGPDTRLPDQSMFAPPDEVAAAIELALFEPQPKRRYMVVADEPESRITIAKQIEQLVQLNEGHPYTYDRDELVRMLDAALRTSRPRVTARGSSANK
jgi:NAD(P)-dependent dehydrogenase (short-subunit alcohol dehydrogenase family)